MQVERGVTAVHIPASAPSTDASRVLAIERRNVDLGQDVPSGLLPGRTLRHGDKIRHRIIFVRRTLAREGRD